MAPEIAPLYLLIQPNPVSSCWEVKPGPAIVIQGWWLLKSVRRSEINEIHFWGVNISIFLGPICKQASAFPHLLEDGICWCFLHQGKTLQPCHHGPGSAVGFGIYCYFFP